MSTGQVLTSLNLGFDPVDINVHPTFLFAFKIVFSNGVT